MKKFTISLILILLSLTNCKHNKVYKTHGLAYLEKRQKLITVNKTNKNDAIKLLGQPSTKSLTDENLWIYIERVQTRGELLKLGRNITQDNNVLVLEFNKFGILDNKEFYDKEHMRKIKFDGDITENEIKQENFIYGFLSSIRQKMIKKK
tara:strand:- start:188 stop:637 length:450 start_codon:yes stop_codon:yes gene_type:complete